MRRIAATTVLLGLAATAMAWLENRPPAGVIEYQPDEAMVVHGSAETFGRDNPILLQDLIPGDATRRLAAGAGELTTLRGYFHASHATGDGQAEANARIRRVQIWGWRDSNGDGRATIDDAKVRDRARRTTRWVKLWEACPDGSDPELPQVDVVGWSGVKETDAVLTSEWRGDLLQSTGTIRIGRGESWLLLLRVIDINGNTNLMAALNRSEAWDNGDTSDGIGTDVPGDKYLDADGHTPGQSDRRMPDSAVVWTYRPAR
jgi:hypothetical protein